MFGSRKRIGYIGPTVMEVVPYEFYRFAPEGIGLVGVTCNIDDWSREHFEAALAQVTAAAAYLGSRGVDFVLHGGGPLVVARGKGGARHPRYHPRPRPSAGIVGGDESVRRLRDLVLLSSPRKRGPITPAPAMSCSGVPAGPGVVMDPRFRGDDRH
jgi:hypothetical protein